MNDQYPSNVEEFIASKWFKKTYTAIKRFHLNEDIEDTMQDILCVMVKTDYLARWSEERGSFSNWLYTFVNNQLRIKYNRSHTRGGRRIEGAISLSKVVDKDESVNIAMLLEAEKGIDGEFNLILDEIRGRLSAGEFKASSSNLANDGVEYSRDVLTVFNLRVTGHSVQEISQKFDTSEQFIYTLLRKIRTVVGDSFFPGN